MNAATEAVKLAENFFWQAHDSAEQQGDRVSMALALGNIATIHKMVFQDVDQARDIYKRAIKCDPRHPILRRNYARLYHDLFDEKVEALTALVRGKACKDSVAKGKIGRTAAQLGRFRSIHFWDCQFRRPADLMACATWGDSVRHRWRPMTLA